VSTDCGLEKMLKRILESFQRGDTGWSAEFIDGVAKTIQEVFIHKRLEC